MINITYIQNVNLFILLRTFVDPLEQRCSLLSPSDSGQKTADLIYISAAVEYKWSVAGLDRACRPAD